jgi:hypothetical protein
MFKSDADNQYHLWYLKRENARDGIQFYDFNRDGRKDFIVSKKVYVDPPGFFRNYADIYVGTSTVEVNEHFQNPLPSQIILYPNYPNPFNPNTRIRFFLPSPMHVFVAIYDITGKEVERLVDSYLRSGEHTRIWEPRDKSTGVYICRLQGGTTVLSQKILLVH